MILVQYIILSDCFQELHREHIAGILLMHMATSYLRSRVIQFLPRSLWVASCNSIRKQPNFPATLDGLSFGNDDMKTGWITKPHVSNGPLIVRVCELQLFLA